MRRLHMWIQIPSLFWKILKVQVTMGWNSHMPPLAGTQHWLLLSALRAGWFCRCDGTISFPSFCWTITWTRHMYLQLIPSHGSHLLLVQCDDIYFCPLTLKSRSFSIPAAGINADPCCQNCGVRTGAMRVQRSTGKRGWEEGATKAGYLGSDTTNRAPNPCSQSLCITATKIIRAQDCTYRASVIWTHIILPF